MLAIYRGLYYSVLYSDYNKPVDIRIPMRLTQHSRAPGWLFCVEDYTTLLPSFIGIS